MSSFYSHPKEHHLAIRFLETGLPHSWLLAIDTSLPTLSQLLSRQTWPVSYHSHFETQPQDATSQRKENIGSAPVTRLAGREECGSQR